MADYKYVNWQEVKKNASNLNLVFLSQLYVEYCGHIYEFGGLITENGKNTGIWLSDVNNGDYMITTWKEIIDSPAFTIMREEAEDA